LRAAQTDPLWEFTCLGGKASLTAKGIGDEALLGRVESQSGEWLADNLDNNQRNGDNKREK